MNIEITVPHALSPILYHAIVEFRNGQRAGILIESLGLFICHYDKFSDKFSVELSEIPADVQVICCYPQSAKARYGLNTIGAWDSRTLITFGFNILSGKLSLCPEVDNDDYKCNTGV
jgi:hypothetical protein